MFKQLRFAFAQALENIRANFFHTFLSILGIVIGVAALVAILSLIDGMEKYAKEQISSTTDLKNIMIRTETHQTINNVRIRKDSSAYLNYAAFSALRENMAEKATGFLFTQQNSGLSLQDKPEQLAAVVTGIAPNLPETEELAIGRKFVEADFNEKNKVAVVNHLLARQIGAHSDPNKLIGKSIKFQGQDFNIIGVLKAGKAQTPTLFIPLIFIPETALSQSPPTCFLEAKAVENVAKIKTETEAWLNQHYPTGKADFEVITNEFRVDQVSKGFLLFRIVMGLIVGISVLVGGIGVMNVLLISVTERTSEIGIRKALGANKNDIMRLFLSESITVSLFGSLLGLTFGVLGTMVFIPIIKAITKVPFQAAYTWNTLLVIMIIAILVGVIFGTYPAMKAARLDPVDAIRRE
ncbi:MAG TPA: ABC transporter permease [Haliscomenobacter sp.]|uniref:ABC transporter permease n=1 Tax=Haliscomenobacter sp. TaxID=2717303 RepID=UPI002C0B5643|nr:ABC transporter permease [Haliscomenobacter sp.]HOY16561.1 ABC transporter permease [Haliscomenobacter sp.]